MSNVLFKPSAFRKYIVVHGLQYGQYDNIRDSYVRSEISSLRFSIESLDVSGVSMTSRHCILTINNRGRSSARSAKRSPHQGNTCINRGNSRFFRRAKKEFLIVLPQTRSMRTFGLFSGKGPSAIGFSPISRYMEDFG